MSEIVRTVTPGHGGNCPQVRISRLPADAARLVRLMQSVGFGTIAGLHVAHGQPVFKPEPVITRELKLGAGYSDHPAMYQSDFYVKAQVVELFELMTKIGTGVITVIDVRFGLPARVAYPVPCEN